MNTQTALDLSSRCAELVALCARFQASFGRRTTLKPGSPGAEWQMYHAILDKQTDIASLLDPTILQAPGEAVNAWWKRQDVIDLSVASDIYQQAAHLIAACAYMDNEDLADRWSYSVHSAQAAIAATLHPTARQRALENISQAAD
jgi:hypothetical protein